MTERDEVAWLRGSLGEDARRPLLFSSAKFGSCHHPDFWSLSADIDDFRPLAEVLLPRQGAAVLITDTQPESHRRHFVGLQLAALLAERGRRVVLVDAEREQEGFSRSLEDPEREGWFDLILYGASPSATVGQAPLVGLRLLTVGSVLPSAGEILEASGIQRGLSQLKHEFDCVLLLRSAGTDRGEWTELFEHCDGVFLLAASADPEAERLVQWLGDKKVPVWGGAVFGKQAVNVDLAIEGSLSEAGRKPDASRTAPEPPAVPTSEPVPAPDIPAAKTHPEAKAEPKPKDRPPPSTAPPEVEEVEPDASSPVFRNVTFALLVALAAFVGWWAWSQREPAPRELVSNSLPPVRSLESDSEPELEGASSPDSIATARQTDQDDGASGAVASGEADDEPAVQDELAAAEKGQESGQIVQESPAEPAEERPAETVELTPAPRPAPEPPPAQSGAATAETDPLLAEVGAGWALHPWSFPDSNEALSALGPLVRRGMKPVVRGFVLEERGRWYRVLVGSFPTRALAMDARERLTELRGIDWVGVVRVP